jgi:hypothetical protein
MTSSPFQAAFGMPDFGRIGWPRLCSRGNWQGGPQGTSHVLEVRMQGTRPLVSLTLHIPAGANIGRGKGTVGFSRAMSQDLGYPEPGPQPGTS